VALAAPKCCFRDRKRRIAVDSILALEEHTSQCDINAVTSTVHIPERTRGQNGYQFRDSFITHYA
jgi:hypothetical protein